MKILVYSFNIKTYFKNVFFFFFFFLTITCEKKSGKGKWMVVIEVEFDAYFLLAFAGHVVGQD